MKFKELQEKAVSKQQQKLMGLALAYKRGEVSGDKVSDTVKDLAKGMSEKELEDFAKTKHKGLPDKVDEVSYKTAMKSYQKAMGQSKDADTAGDKKTGDKKFDQAVKFGRYATKKFKSSRNKKKLVRTFTGKESVEEAFSGKEVKMAMGIAADPRYKQGNYSDAVRKIERIAKGLSKHPSVAAYLKRMNEAKDPNEYDNEGEMAKTQLKTIVRNAEDMMDIFDDEENMPEWVQSKITKASDYMTSAYNYMASEDEEDDDDEKKVDEAMAAGDRVGAIAAIGGAALAAKKVKDRFDPVKVAKARREREERKREREQAQKEIDDRKRQRAMKRRSSVVQAAGKLGKALGRMNKPARRPAG
jgi:hypothetical protein